MKRSFKGKHEIDIPENIEAGIVYVIGDRGNKWVSVLKCPCNCGETIQLNLLKETRPFWKVIVHMDNTVTIIPSIRRIVGCKSHFVVKKSKIRWVYF